MSGLYASMKPILLFCLLLVSAQGPLSVIRRYSAKTLQTEGTRRLVQSLCGDVPKDADFLVFISAVGAHIPKKLGLFLIKAQAVARADLSQGEGPTFAVRERRDGEWVWTVVVPEGVDLERTVLELEDKALPWVLEDSYELQRTSIFPDPASACFPLSPGAVPRQLSNATQDESCSDSDSCDSQAIALDILIGVLLTAVCVL